jgi:hypothetical protein
VKIYYLCICDFKIWGCRADDYTKECKFCNKKCQLADKEVVKYINNTEIFICPYCWQITSQEKAEDIFAPGAGVQSIFNEFYLLGKTAIFSNQWKN